MTITVNEWQLQFCDYQEAAATGQQEGATQQTYIAAIALPQGCAPQKLQAWGDGCKADLDVTQRNAEAVAEVHGKRDLLEQPACIALRQSPLNR